jgi:glycosyltransferase involved in cell wall biosynthesis
MNDNTIKLTIGIATIPSRMFDDCFLPRLIKKIENQIGERKDVEIIILGDNKKITIGKKRDRLIQMAQGKFVVLVDDDDDVSDDYVEIVCDAIDKNPDVDVISYMQKAIIDGEEWVVDFSLNYDRTPPLEQLSYEFTSGWIKNPEDPLRDIFKTDIIVGKKVCKRPPFPVCPFRTELAKQSRFIDFNSSEDTYWARKMWDLCRSEYKLNKQMHIYIWNSNVSEAPLMSPEGAKEVEE